MEKINMIIVLRFALSVTGSQSFDILEEFSIGVMLNDCKF